MPPSSLSPDKLDLDIVADQLGRLSADAVHPVARIMIRCPWQLPAVVECLPYDSRGTPFPTLFYLTCPSAVAAVSRLECGGWSNVAEETLAASPELMRSVAAAQAYERRRRRQLVAGPAAEGAATANDGGAVLAAGIGGGRCPAHPNASCTGARRLGSRRPGTREAPPLRVKCLHAHAAHALARPAYAFGATLLERARAIAGSLWCDDARCAHRGAQPARRTRSGGGVRASVNSRSLVTTGESARAAAAGAMRVAVVDLGTNTCRLLLARVGPDWCGPVEGEMRATTVVRLGQGVDETGRLAPEAVRRTRDCLAGYAESIQRFGPDRKILIATSALRDAADGYELLAAVEQDLGLPWRVLGGEEEAVTTFRGAICGIAGLAVARPLATSAAIRRAVLVIDIGGGSTELVVGHVPAACYSARTRGHAERPATAAERAAEPATPTFVCSVDAGAVRLTERYFRHDPPSAAEWAAAVRRTRALLRAAVPPHVSSRVGGAVGVAGTITTLVANKLGLRSYRSELVDGEPLHLREIEQAIVLFRRLTSAERGRLPGIQPGREDVILAGALIAREVCLFFGLPGVRCGESDILEGTALQLAGEQRT